MKMVYVNVMMDFLMLQTKKNVKKLKITIITITIIMKMMIRKMMKIKITKITTITKKMIRKMMKIKITKITTITKKMTKKIMKIIMIQIVVEMNVVKQDFSMEDSKIQNVINVTILVQHVLDQKKTNVQVVTMKCIELYMMVPVNVKMDM